MRQYVTRIKLIVCFSVLFCSSFRVFGQQTPINLYHASTPVGGSSFNAPVHSRLTVVGPIPESTTHYNFSSGYLNGSIAAQQRCQPMSMAGLLRDSQTVHSPRKATLLALTLPGAGQIYNRKYWKAPIVYAGLGGSVYAIGHFKQRMHVLNDSIAKIYSLGKTPSALLLQDRDKQRSSRDVAILCLAGVYVLQVLDAVVDAHFYQFNINEKIGMEWNAAPSRMLALHYQL